MTQLRDIPLKYIRSTPQNPRSDLVEDDDLRGLAASLGSADDPQLAGPPVVEEVSENDYRILAGERRIRAARLAEWQQIICLVRPRLDPVQAHTLRLLENLHRQELHPLDKAAGLKITWYTANADAMGLQTQAREVLAIEQTPAETLIGLEALLQAHAFAPTRPAVPWEVVLDRLGLAMHPQRRKRLLRVLGIESSVQARVRELEISEASLRSLGTLAAEDQARLVEAITQDPTLGRRVRRIAHAVNQHEYKLEEALAEARGQVYLDGEAPGSGVTGSGDLPEVADEESSHEGVPAAALLENDISDVILELLEAANQVSVTLGALVEAIGEGQLSDLPQPWNEYAQEALDLMQSEIEALSLRTQA